MAAFRATRIHDLCALAIWDTHVLNRRDRKIILGTNIWPRGMIWGTHLNFTGATNLCPPATATSVEAAPLAHANAALRAACVMNHAAWAKALVDATEVSASPVIWAATVHPLWDRKIILGASNWPRRMIWGTICGCHFPRGIGRRRRR